MSQTDYTDQICDAFEKEWQNGEPADLAAWIQLHVPQTSRALLIELARVDLEYRSKIDSQLDVDAYLSQFGLSSTDVTTPDEDLTADCTLPANRGTQVGLRPSIAGARIGHFRILREIGRGGFGCVYLAFDDRLKREVALKVPRALLDEPARQRFMREAEAAASLEHFGIVPVFEAGDWEGECYIASAFCPGQNLSQWLKQQDEVPAESAAQVVRCVAEAMQHAHNRGVVHRDLKPSNVMLVPVEGAPAATSFPFVPRITDFGLAKLVESRMEDTNSSVMLGTPSYMAPEQFAAEPLDTDKALYATDIYALGVVLYELLVGRRPHEGRAIVEVMDAVRKGDIPPPTKFRSNVPRDLETICLKCLSLQPEARYQSCADLAQDLSLFLQGKPINARRPALREKIRSWLSSPARVYETGLLSMLIGIGAPVWITLMTFLVWKDGLEASVGLELIPQAIALFLFVLFPLCYAGYRTILGSRKWMWVGLAEVVLSLPQVVPPLFGTVFIFPEMYERYPLGRIIAYSCLSLLFLVQTVQYAIILRYPRR